MAVIIDRGLSGKKLFGGGGGTGYTCPQILDLVGGEYNLMGGGGGGQSLADEAY